MSEDFHLPDDVNKWPRDPWAVLGVDSNAELSEIRSAYAALIRRFKPEHHPQEFGRIRDAFDRARRSRGHFTGPSHDDPFEPTSPLEPSELEAKMVEQDEATSEKGGKAAFWKTAPGENATKQHEDSEVKAGTSDKEFIGKLLPSSPKTTVAADAQSGDSDGEDDTNNTTDSDSQSASWPDGPSLLELIDAESIDVPEFEYVKFSRRVRRIGGKRDTDADNETSDASPTEVQCGAGESDRSGDRPAIKVIRTSTNILDESTETIETADKQPAESTDSPAEISESAERTDAKTNDDTAADPADKSSSQKEKDDKRPYSGRQRRRPMPVEDRSESAWIQAAKGYPRASYRDHLELLAEAPGKSLIYARLYWLLTLFPELDPALHRCDWLIRGLEATDASRNLLDLALREIDGDANLAAEPRWLDALDLDMPSEKLISLINCRWRGCSRTENWQQIVDDFERFRSRFEYENHETWLRIMLVALDYLVWVDEDQGRELAETIRDELEDSCSDFFELENDLVRSDMLCELEEACTRLEISVTFRSPRIVGLRRLVRDSWNEPAEQLYGQWVEFFVPLVADPLTGLADLSRIERFRPFLMHFINEQVSQLHNARFGYDSLTIPYSLIDSLLTMCDQRERTWSRYTELRSDVLRFCLEHEITISQFVREMPSQTKDRLEHYGALEELQADRSLSCFLMGYRLVYCTEE